MNQTLTVLDFIFKEDFLKECKLPSRIDSWSEVKQLTRVINEYVANWIQKDLIKGIRDKEMMSEYQAENKAKINREIEGLTFLEKVEIDRGEKILTQSLILSIGLEVEEITNGYFSSNKMQELQSNLDKLQKQHFILIPRTKNINLITQQIRQNLRVLNPFNTSILKNNTQESTYRLSNSQNLKNVILIGGNQQMRKDFTQDIVKLVSTTNLQESIYSSSYSIESCEDQNCDQESKINTIYVKTSRADICIINAPQCLKQLTSEEQFMNNQRMRNILDKLQSVRILILIEKQELLRAKGITNFISKLNSLFPDYNRIKNSVSFIFYQFTSENITQLFQQFEEYEQQPLKNKNTKLILNDIKQKTREIDKIQIYIPEQKNFKQCKRILNHLSLQSATTHPINQFNLNLSSECNKSINDQFEVLKQSIIQFFKAHNYETSKHYMQEIIFLSQNVRQNKTIIEAIKKQLTNIVRFTIDEWSNKIKDSVNCLSLSAQERQDCVAYLKGIDKAKVLLKSFLKVDMIESSILQLSKSFKNVLYQLLERNFNSQDMGSAKITTQNLKLLIQLFPNEHIKIFISKQKQDLIQKIKISLIQAAYQNSFIYYCKYQILHEFSSKEETNNAQALLNQLLSQKADCKYKNIDKLNISPNSIKKEYLQTILEELDDSHKILSSSLVTIFQQRIIVSIQDWYQKYKKVIEQFIKISKSKGSYCIRSLAYDYSQKLKEKQTIIKELLCLLQTLSNNKIFRQQSLKILTQFKTNMDNSLQSQQTQIKKEVSQLTQQPFSHPCQTISKLISFLSNLLLLKNDDGNFNMMLDDFAFWISKFIDSVDKKLQNFKVSVTQSNQQLKQNLQNIYQLQNAVNVLKSNNFYKQQTYKILNIETRILNIIENLVNKIIETLNYSSNQQYQYFNIAKLEDCYKTLSVLQNISILSPFHKKLSQIKTKYQSLFTSYQSKFNQTKEITDKFDIDDSFISSRNVRKIKQFLMMMQQIQNTEHISDKMQSVGIMIQTIRMNISNLYYNIQDVLINDCFDQRRITIINLISKIQILSDFDNILGQKIGCFRNFMQKLKEFKISKENKIKKSIHVSLIQSSFSKLNQILLEFQGQSSFLSQLCQELQVYVRRIIEELRNQRIKIMFEKKLNHNFIQKLTKLIQIKRQVDEVFINCNDQDLAILLQSQIDNSKSTISYISQHLKALIQTHLDSYRFDTAFNTCEIYRTLYHSLPQECVTGITPQTKITEKFLMKIKQTKAIFDDILEQDYKYLRYYKKIMDCEIDNPEIESLKQEVFHSIVYKVEEMVRKYENGEVDYEHFTNWNSFLPEQFKQSIIQKPKLQYRISRSVKQEKEQSQIEGMKTSRKFKIYQENEQN